MKGFKREQVRELVTGILHCLRALRKLHIVHCDLKPENMLIQDMKESDKINVKLTDFGFATTFKKGEKQDLSLGSPLYMAPELVLE